jgi:hypothetical protein
MMLLTALVSSSDHRLVDLDVNNGYDDDKDEDTSDHDGADGGWMECHVESTCLEYENIGREMRRSDELWRTYDTVVIARLGRQMGWVKFALQSDEISRLGLCSHRGFNSRSTSLFVCSSHQVRLYDTDLAANFDSVEKRMKLLHGSANQFVQCNTLH